MTRRWLITFAAAALCTGCLNTGEFGGEGADCDEDLLCAVDFVCVDGACTAASNVPDMGSPSDADEIPDQSTPDMTDGDPDSGDDDTSQDMPAPPCDNACTGATPVCDEDTETCVPCLADGDCTDGVCLAGATTTANACVPCRDTSDCTDGVCDTDTNSCVPCLADADCTDPTAAKCELGATTADNACVACDDSGQCAGVPDAAICDSGTCIECRPATEETDCGTTFCDPATNECTQTVLGTATGCETCGADTDCAAGHRCLELQYAAALDGNFCMPVFDASSGMCPRPFGFGRDSRTSVDGASTDFCLIKEDNTTCGAVSEYEDDCSMANMCTATGSSCRDINGVDGCSYTCAGDRDCKPGVECGGPLNDEYCGG